MIKQCLFSVVLIQLLVLLSRTLIAQHQPKDSIYSEWDEEAVRIVKLMPKWKPGEMNGKPVAVWYNLPFIVCLSE